MAHEVGLINGITKKVIEGGYKYEFPTTIIRTNTANSYMTITPRGESDNEYVEFRNISNKLGASTIEEYVDTLCNRRYYTYPVPSNGAEISLFNELEVAQRFPLIEQKSAYPVSNLRENITITGSATMTQVNGEYKLSTTANGADSLEDKTFEIGRDISHTDANNGVGVRFPVAPTGNIYAEWGLYNGTDGALFGYDATGLYIRLVRAGVQAVKVYSPDWIDEDGYASQIDMTKGNVFNLDIAHYGYGPIVFSIYTENSGLRYRKYVLHRLEFNGGVNLVNPNLPIYAKVDNAGTATAFDMYLGGRQYSIVGAYSPTFRRNGDLGTFSVGVTPTLIVSFRRKSAFRMVNVKLSELGLAPNDTLYFYVVQGNTLTGASWVNITNQQVGETALEKDLTATNALDGIVVKQGFAVGGNRNEDRTVSEVELTLGNQAPFSLYLRSASGTVTGTWSMDFLEEW